MEKHIFKFDDLECVTSPSDLTASWSSWINVVYNYFSQIDELAVKLSLIQVFKQFYDSRTIY